MSVVLPDPVREMALAKTKSEMKVNSERTLQRNTCEVEE